MLRQLVAGDQLAVSSCGSHAAIVRGISHDREVVTHSELGGLFLFDRQTPESGARILRVDEDGVLVWGATKCKSPGVWHLTSSMRKYLFPMSVVHGFYGNTQRVPVGESDLYPGASVLAMPWGLWPMTPGARIEVSGNRLFVLERFDKQWHAYCVGADGVERFVQVRGEPLRFMPWRSSSALLVSRVDGGVVMSEMGVPKSCYPFTHDVEGEYIDSWVSHCTRSNTYALLTRVSDGQTRLSLNGWAVHEGQFTMRHDDLSWSHHGQAFVACIQEGGRERVVTTREKSNVPPGVRVQQALASDEGRLAAMIVNDGVWDRILLVGDRAGTAVTSAWNLHQDPSGAVVWNSIYDNQILRWTDRTRR
jgi:hypothetical protein